MPFVRPNLPRLLAYLIVGLAASTMLLVVLAISTTHWIHTARIRAGLWKLCHLQPLACFHSITRSPAALSITGLCLIVLGSIGTIIFDLIDCHVSLSRRYLSFISLCSFGSAGFFLALSYLVFAHLTGQFCYSFYLMIMAQLFIMYAAMVASYLQGRRYALASASVIMTRLEVRKA